MKPVLLVDFGSTYTKVTAVDLDEEEILGTGVAYTTIQTDVGDGLKNALAMLEEKTGHLDYAETHACSSAAGGLRMVTSGLVPELTSEAARMASLGAGAKLVGIYSYEMTEDDIADIAAMKPDIFLLVGGTDGGNKACILHNAQMLASMEPAFPIVIAGNRSVMKECSRILEKHEIYICENVMPKFGVLKIEDVQKKIRDIFLRNIVKAKGLTKAVSLMNDIVMPTPAAVMQAMTLLADGSGKEKGIGELIGVDVGGATTDVYSIAKGLPQAMNTVTKGIPELYAKRTVEGDIGMRYSIRGIVDAAGIERIAELAAMTPERAAELVDLLASRTETLPKNDPELVALDRALASMAVETAVMRHSGTLEETFTMMGQTFVQTGKDLRSVRKIIVTGGSLIHTDRTAEIAGFARWNSLQPQSLRPLEAEIWVDRKYILAAMGLLSRQYPEAALRIMKKELERNGNPE